MDLNREDSSRVKHDINHKVKIKCFGFKTTKLHNFRLKTNEIFVAISQKMYHNY